MYGVRLSTKYAHTSTAYAGVDAAHQTGLLATAAAIARATSVANDAKKKKRCPTRPR